MATFSLNPNLRVLNSVLTDTTEEEFDKHNQGYKPHTTQITLHWAIFEDEEKFQTDFKDLLATYNLSEHFDNLLYLTLSVYNSVWEDIEVASEQYESKKRSRDLAQLLLLLMDTKQGKLSNLTFKSLTQTVKLNDTTINDWIGSLITKSIESNDFPISKFGTYVLQMLSASAKPLESGRLNKARLTHYANMRMVNPRNLIKKGAATISLAVLSYLNSETDLCSTEVVMFTTTQMKFLFDLLELLKQTDDDKLPSDKEDYMRTLLLNQIHS